jgi:hypothetical protein
MPQFVRNLNQPGTIAPEQQQRIMQDAMKKHVMPPDMAVQPGFHGEPSVGPTIGMHAPSKGNSPLLPGVPRQEIRGLAERGRALSRAGGRARGVGGGVGGLIGGVGGNMLYDWFSGNE